MQINTGVVAGAAADLSRGEVGGLLSSGGRGEERWRKKKKERKLATSLGCKILCPIVLCARRRRSKAGQIPVGEEWREGGGGLTGLRRQPQIKSW